MASVLEERSLRNWTRWADFGLPSLFGFSNTISTSKLTSVPESLETVDEDREDGCWPINVLDEYSDETDLPPF